MRWENTVTSDDEFYTLRDQPLTQTADEMEAGQREYPEQHINEDGVVFPAFPAALRMVAEADPPQKCIACHKPGYDYPADRAYAPGHCYSPSGVREFTSISSCCEFCFDHMMREPDEEQEPMDDSHARIEDGDNLDALLRERGLLD